MLPRPQRQQALFQRSVQDISHYYMHSKDRYHIGILATLFLAKQKDIQNIVSGKSTPRKDGSVCSYEHLPSPGTRSNAAGYFCGERDFD